MNRFLIPLLLIIISVTGACVREPDTLEAKVPVSAEAALVDVLQARRQIQMLGFVATGGDAYRRAEEDYRKALVAADAGDLRAAAASAGYAVAAYRAATLSALNGGPARLALERFDKAAAKLPERRLQAAEREANRLRGLLDDARGGEFNPGELTDQALEISAQLEDFVGADQAVVVPQCPTPVQPEFIEVMVSEAAAGTLLTRSRIHYVAGGELDITLVIPECTFVSDVFADLPGGSHRFATDASIYDLIEGTIINPYYYSVIDRTREDSQLTVRLRLHFPTYRDGRTRTFRLLVESVKGSLGAEESVVVVGVSEINAVQTIGISQYQLRNGFVVGQYQDFGDNGRKQEDPVDLIDPSYKALTLDITTAGIDFRSRLKADFTVCDPTITSSGLFHLAQNGAQTTVVWDVGPTVDVTLPLLCEIGATLLGPLTPLGRFIFEGMVEDRVETQVQQRIDALTAGLGAGTSGATTFVQSFETVQGELVVHLNIPGDKVAIEVPYGRLWLEEAADSGMALNPGEQILITASGLADACNVDGNPLPDCDRKQVGPAGLFNWSVNVPIPTPWPCFADSGTCAYFKQRHEARKRLQGLRRDESELPFPEENVGALVGRLANQTSTSRYRLLNDTCTITAGDSFDRLAFGANDYRYVGAAELGNGTWRASIIWPQIALTGLGCGTSSFSLPGLLEKAGIVGTSAADR